MASSIDQHFICHFCSDGFPDRSSLISHFSHCHMKTSPKQTVEKTRLPRLNKTEHDMLQMLKLHRSNDKRIFHKDKTNMNTYLQIPLSIGHFNSSKQSSFDDTFCHTNNIPFPNDDQSDSEFSSNILNTKSYHLYKYSRREQKNFYASIKKARLKKHFILLKKSRPTSFIFDPTKHFFINLPTKINSRLRLNTNSNNSYPLIFDSNFNSLVQLSTNNLFIKYFSDINNYFHLIHSIVSQEFQIIVNSNDNQQQQQQFSYTAFSFMNILRQTMMDYSRNLQKNFKRNYFQSFQCNDQQVTTAPNSRRYDQTPPPPPSSSSSDIQIDDNHHRRPVQINTNLTSTNVPIRNFIHTEDNHSTMQTDHHESQNRINTPAILSSFIPIIEEPKLNKSPSPMIIKEQKIEPTDDYPSNIIPNERARIRIINGSNDDNNIKSSSRKTNPRKRSTPIDNVDENSLIKNARMSTRKNSLINIKTPDIMEIYPPYLAKPVVLTFYDISKQWLTHNVFYRCHACSHEEFFVALSRECMNLHISSKHGNMEENFKQRVAHFLNNKGHALKIFQHYLKWQQPWSEKEVEQIFQLSNKW